MIVINVIKCPVALIDPSEPSTPSLQPLTFNPVTFRKYLLGKWCWR